jgi:hypothetical protein
MVNRLSTFNNFKRATHTLMEEWERNSPSILMGEWERSLVPEQQSRTDKENSSD